MIEFMASADHYLSHLQPVIDVFGDAAKVYRRTPPRGAAPVVVASADDLAAVTRTRHQAVLFEHGSGQFYNGVNHRSYAGGPGRHRVILFICPNQAVADANLARNPKATCVVIGSPRVDTLRRIERAPGPTTVAISFHWRCKVAPEAGTALDHYRDHIDRLRIGLYGCGIDLIGHAHPRIAAELRPLYAAAGVEWVPRFEDVVARADAYACDNSSTLFEFAALDRPVVVLNCPAYRRDVNHGLRFWDEAGVGVQVDGPEGLLIGILAALEDLPAKAERRRATVARVYGEVDGLAAARAADALRSLA